MKCWEYMKCGRDHVGGCPAWPSNGARCAEAVGTFCPNKKDISGINAIKLRDCRRCRFYNSEHYAGKKYS